MHRGCEKNWCYVYNAAQELKVVYDWSPLTIGSTDGDNLRITGSFGPQRGRDSAVPDFFRDVRGSTNGVSVGNERWFLCHIANYTTPRTYYHVIIVLDENLAFKRNSILFKFQDICIEYALGMIVEDERLIITYSTMDRTSTLMTLPREVVEKELFA
jgi:hypothetical protein